MATADFPYPLCVDCQGDSHSPMIKNKLIIYFQSKKSSEGGDCDVEYPVSGGHTAIVRFKLKEVRQRVLDKQTHELKIGKKTVKLTLSLPLSEASVPQESTSLAGNVAIKADESKIEENVEIVEPPEETEEDTTPKSAVIENIQNSGQEFLAMLVENVMKGSSAESKDFSIESIPESNCAVVTFSNSKYADHFFVSSPSNGIIKRKSIKVRLLEMTSKVKAEGLPLNSSSDYIMLYFDKFAEVEDDGVEFETDDSAIITFKNPEDVQKVLKEQHQIKKHVFRVLPYYESLQTALYGKDRPTMTLPEAFIEKIDRTVWHHLKENRKSLDLVMQAMSSHFCEMDFQTSAVKISPSKSLLNNGAQTKKLIHKWRENALSMFLESISKLKFTELHIQKDAWTEIQPEIEKAVFGETVTLVPYVDEETIAVAGLKEDMNRIEGILTEIVERVTQRIKREKGSETEEFSMTPSIYNIVLCDGLEQQMCDKFPEMNIAYNKHSRKLTFYGLKQEVLETKNTILQAFLSLRRKPIELDQSVLDFLNTKDVEEMTRELFINKGINVALEADGKGVLLVGKTDKALNVGEKQLQTDLGHLSFDVKDPSVLVTSDWHDLVSHIKNTVVNVTVQTTVNQVVVSGFVDYINDVEQELYNFVQENSHFEKTLKSHKTVVTFIKDHKRQDWFEDVKGKVKVDFKGEDIVISGSRLHVSTFVPLFEDLLSSIYHSTLKIVKPGAKKFFKEKELMCVTCAKTNLNCFVQLLDELDNSHDTVHSRILKPVYHYKTHDGMEIIVNKSDMCLFQVDAVVGACKENLLLDGGLVKALSDAAGPKLQNDCDKIAKRRTFTIGDAVLLEAGGQLQCKHVILAIGPHYNSSKPKESEKLLKKTVRKCLNLADQESFQSLAIPAISSGVCGFPLDLCADTIVKAIKEFCDFVEGDNSLKKIHLVDNNDKTVQALEAAVKKVYGVSVLTHSLTSGSISSSQQQNQNQNQASSSPSQHQIATLFQGKSESFQTKEGLNITLMKGNIEDTTMDVVVNTLSSDLNLSVGAISNALLKAAGPQLQVLLNQQVTGTASVGAVFETAGANLKNKMVFHAVVPHWNQGQGNEQKVLEDVIDKCLNQAEQHSQSSIVFSAIGTGNLGFPKPLVVCTMLDSAFKFSSKRGSKHVKEVVFVLHPKDTQTIQVFTDEFSKRFLGQSASASNPPQPQSTGPFSKVTTKSGIHETTVGGVTLQVLYGDITVEKTDVIVNSSNKEFTAKSGVSKAIVDKAGPNVETECQQLGAQANSGLIMTQAGNLQCKKIIHIAAHSDAIKIKKHVKSALEMCAKEKLTSIAFPAIGTGQAGLSPGQVADSMMDGMLEMIGKNPQSTLKLIRLVVFQNQMLPEFHRSMQNREIGPAKQEQSTWSKIKAYAANVKSFFTGSWEKEIKQHGGKDFVIEGVQVDPVFFSICGPSQADVDKTKRFLEDMINQEQVFQPITDTAILTLSEKEQQRIQDLQSSIDVTITLKYKAHKGSLETPGEATLVVQGLSRDVLKATQEIQDMLKTAKEKESQQKEMEFASELVDWQYEQSGQYKSFDQFTNFELEKAIARQATDIKISFQGQTYKVTLPEGPAVSTSGGNQMNIRRIDKLKATEDIPQNWDAMAPSELYKMFNLQPTSTEYKDVLGRFQATCRNNVLKIERIQNPGMWKNYQNNKSVMEKKNGHQNNEKRLFHGTSEATIIQINKHGFNRSYAGKNATAYGKGTYFALNASYSSSGTYSVPNAQGHKHMYLCKVLTGDYTTGNSAMIVPPAKNANCDPYDTVVDNPAAPTIFVVFRDDHAYPEYLITFT